MDKKRLRNLSCGEIVAQFICQRKAFSDFPSSALDRTVSNIVFMGQGEPLYNYKNVKKAVQVLVDGDGLSISKVGTNTQLPKMDCALSDLGNQHIRGE